MPIEFWVILAGALAIAFFEHLRKKEKAAAAVSRAPPNLRPSSLAEVVGQPRAKKIIGAMTSSGRLSDHLLLVGPAGTGKTTLAYIAAAGAKLHLTIGSQLRTPADAMRALAAGSDMLFVDEVHSASRKALEVFYMAMEDSTTDWRLIAGTTDSGKLPTPFRDRFGETIYLNYYTNSEIYRIIKRSAQILGVTLTVTQIKDIAKRSRSTPRIANALLKRIQDFTKKGGVVDLPTIWETLGIDAQGLNELDRQVLETLRTSQKPMGLEQVARRIGVDTATISGAVEPYLLRRGLMDIRSGGRVAV